MGERGVHGVHQPPADLAGGLAQDGEDRRRDEQPDGRVGQCRGADLLAGADAVPGRQLVVREPGQGGGGHRDEVRDPMRVRQADDCLAGGQDRRRRDHQHDPDHDPGQVLGAAVPVRNKQVTDRSQPAR
jgi:hypothetical protein